MKKKEKIFIAIVLLAAVAAWAGMHLLRAGIDYGSITITVDGREFGTYSLGKNQTIKIGDTNVCEIKDGKARMTDATCPDHLCTDQQGPIDSDGGLIVCLPNRVVIEGKPAESASDNSQIDAVS